MIKFEKKLLLTEEEYAFLLKELVGIVPAVKHIDYYFDTEELTMNEKNITCRIRLKNDNYKATIKKYSIYDKNSVQSDVDICQGLQENIFVDFGLTLQGELVTYRSVLVSNELYKVILDKNEYLGCVDYEIKIEYYTDYEIKVNIMLQSIIDTLLIYNHNLVPNEIISRLKDVQKSKAQRFFEKKCCDKKKI